MNFSTAAWASSRVIPWRSTWPWSAKSPRRSLRSSWRFTPGATNSRCSSRTDANAELNPSFRFLLTARPTDPLDPVPRRSAHRAVGDLERAVERGERLVQLRLGDDQRRRDHEVAHPAHHGDTAL